MVRRMNGTCPPPAYANNNNGPGPYTTEATYNSNGYHDVSSNRAAVYSGVYTASSVVDPSALVEAAATSASTTSVEPPPGYTSVIVDATHQQYLHHHHHHHPMALGADFPVH